MIMEVNYLTDIYEYRAISNPFKNRQKFQKLEKKTEVIYKNIAFGIYKTALNFI